MSRHDTARHEVPRAPIWPLAAIAALSVVASPEARADEKPQLLVMDFRAEGVEKGQASLIMDVVTSTFAKTGRFEVKSSDDIAELLNLEASKTTLGCADDSCMAEIAGAMGAEFVVTGRIGKLGETFIVKVAVLMPATAKTVGQETVQSKSLDELPARLKPVIEKLTLQALDEPVPDELMRRVERASSTKRAKAEVQAVEEGGFPWIGVSVAGAGVVIAAGGLLAGVAALAFSQWATTAWLDPSVDGGQKTFIRDAGLPVFAGLAGVGFMALVVGVLCLPVGLTVGFFE